MPTAPKRWTPYEFHKRAVKFGLANAAAGFFLDPGLGKTSIMAAIFKILKRDGAMRGAFVIAPLRVCKLVWPAEFKKWIDFNGMSVGVLHGDHKQAVLEQDHDVYVINPEGLPWLFKREKVKSAYKNTLTAAGKLLMSKANILVIDELSKFKHPDTNRFKLMKPWLKKFDRRYGLTGSPAANGLMGLFGECYMLDEGRSLGTFITYYREQYFTALDKQGFEWRLKAGAEELIYERIRPLVLRMSAEDHLELPQLRPHIIKLDLPPKARELYDTMEADFLIKLQDTTVTAANSAVAKGMCRQICSGALYKPQIDFVTGLRRAGEREWELLHNEKLTAMQDLIDELQGQPLLVAYEFKHDLERMLKVWPDMPYFGQSEKKDAELERAWNTGTLPLLAGQPQSVAHGLNLQQGGCHNILWFTLTWDYELYDQFVRRLLRQGNAATYVNCYHLIVRDSVEESVVWGALKGKKRVQDDLFQALVSKRRVEE